MILIQRITTEWTKASRGGRGATVRNSFPEAFPVPPFDATISPFVVHTVRFREWENFERHEDLNGFGSATDAHIEPIRIYNHNDHLVVRFVWDWMQCGAPERESHEIFQLVPGKWARFVCNGRFGPTSSSGCVWHYHKTVFNIAFNQSPDADLFVATMPQSVQNRLAKLK
jgi:hypothetical protein